MKKKKKFKKGDMVETPKGIGLIAEIKFSHIYGTLMVVKLRQSIELFKPKELLWLTQECIESKRDSTRSKRDGLIFEIHSWAKHLSEEKQFAIKALNSQRLGVIELKALLVLVKGIAMETTCI